MWYEQANLGYQPRIDTGDEVYPEQQKAYPHGQLNQ